MQCVALQSWVAVVDSLKKVRHCVRVLLSMGQYRCGFGQARWCSSPRGHLATSSVGHDDMFQRRTLRCHRRRHNGSRACVFHPPRGETSRTSILIAAMCASTEITPQLRWIVMAPANDTRLRSATKKKTLSKRRLARRRRRRHAIHDSTKQNRTEQNTTERKKAEVSQSVSQRKAKAMKEPQVNAHRSE